MNLWKKMLPYLLIIAGGFYLLPLLIRDTGSAMVVLLILVPAICLLSSVFYGVKNSFHWQFCVMVALLFVPSVFLFYNASAWVYIIGYGANALIGNLIGSIFSKKRKNTP